MGQGIVSQSFVIFANYTDYFLTHTMRRIFFITLCTLVQCLYGQDGSIDPSFSTGTGGTSNVIIDLAVTSDESIVAVGSFNTFNGEDVGRVVKISSTGKVDEDFNSTIGSGADNTIMAVALLPDERIVIGGSFLNFNGVKSPYLTVLDPSGKMDASFALQGESFNDEIYDIGIQSDGKIIVVGAFTSYDGNQVGHIARLNQDGSLDTDFSSVKNGANDFTWTVEIASDDAIYIGGEFTTYNGSEATRFAKLDKNGQHDASFDTQKGVSGNSPIVFDIALSGDQVFLAGNFEAYDGAERGHIASANKDGSINKDFDTENGASGEIHSIDITATGAIIAGGVFNGFGGLEKNKFVKINTDGTADTKFDIGNAADKTVEKVYVNTDNSIYIAGAFTKYHETDVLNKIAKIQDSAPNNDNEEVSIYIGKDPSGKLVTNNQKEPIDFGTLAAGEKTEIIFTIQNNSTSDLDINDIKSSSSSFIIEHSVSSIKVNDFANFSVVFQSSTGGSHDGSIVINSSNKTTPEFTFPVEGTIMTSTGAPLIEVYDGSGIGGTQIFNNQTNIIDLGTTPAGTPLFYNFTIHNAGDDDLQIESISSNNINFTASHSFSTVAPSTSEVFTVTFNPSIVGLQTATISISNNDGQANPFVFVVEAEMLASTPEIDVYANFFPGDDPVFNNQTGIIDLGTTTVGETLSYEFTIDNPGSGDLQIEGINSDNANFVPDFSFSSVISSLYETFSINFTSSVPGPQTARISISNNDDDEHPFVFYVQATVQSNGSPEIEVYDGDSPSSPLIVNQQTESIDFGSVEVGNTITRTFTIENTGTAPLGIEAINIDNASFIVTHAISSVDVGKYETFTITLASSTPDDYSATVGISNEDDDESPYRFQINGSITPELLPSIQVHNGPDENSPEIFNNQTSTVNIGSTPRGTNLTHTFTIANTGSGPLNINDIKVNSSVFQITNTLSEIAAGTSESFTVTLLGNNKGNFTGTISIVSDDQSNNPFEYQIGGQVLTPEIGLYEGNSISGTPLNSNQSVPVDFGKTELGTDIIKEFTIVNSGLNALDITKLTVSSPWSSDLPIPTSIAAGSEVNFNITLDASVAGNVNGFLNIVSNDAEDNDNPFVVPLSGQVTAPEITVSEESGGKIISGQTSIIDLGSSIVGTDLSAQFNISNSGTSDLIITNTTTDNGLFEVNKVPSTVAAISNENFEIVLLGDTPGQHTATIIITNNDSDENPFTFIVSGEILAPQVSLFEGKDNTGNPLPNTTSTKVDFGSIEIGDKNEIVFAIENTGTTDLIISDILASGTAFIIDGAPTSVKIGATQNFSVVMTSNAPGEFENVLTVYSDDPNNDPYEITLTGDVTAPEISVFEGGVLTGTELFNNQTSSIDFGSELEGTDITLTFSLRNSGSSDLTISSIDISGTSFSVNGAPSVVVQDNTSTFTITLSSAQAGTFNGSVKINSNDSDENPFVFDITGQIIAPELDVFTGTDVTGSPIVNGQTSAINFGSTTQGIDLTQVFTIINNGDFPLTIASINVPNDEFSVTHSITTLSPSQSGSFTVTLDGNSAPKSYNDNITILSNDSDENPFVFQIEGTISIAPEPELDVYAGTDNSGVPIADAQTSAYDLGSSILGTGISQTFVLVNSGTNPLVVSNISISGTDFTLSSSPSTIPIGGSTLFTVDLSGNTLGTYEETIKIVSDDADESPFTFNITGTISAPEIEVYDGTNLSAASLLTNGQINTVNYGDVLFGNDLTRTFTIENTGTSALTISDISSSSSAYIILQDINSIAPGTSESFTVTLLSNTIGFFSSNITIISDDLDEGTFVFPLEGIIVSPEIGVSQNTIPISSNQTSPVDFGSWVVTDDATLTFELHNEGTSTLTISSIDVSGTTYSINESITTIASGATSTFTITLATTAVGTFDEIVTIISDDNDESTFTFPITGQVTSPIINVFDEDASLITNGQSTPIDMGTIPVTDNITRTFTLSNTGSSTLDISSITVNDANFSVENSISSIAVGNTASFTIAFSGNIVNSYNATVTINSNDPITNAFSFTISGTLTESEINVYVGTNNTGAEVQNNQTEYINTGSAEQGKSLSQTFLIENTGTSALEIISIFLEQENFVVSDGAVGGNVKALDPINLITAFTTDQLAIPVYISPGSSHEFTISLNALNPGEYIDTVIIISNDPDDNQFSYEVRGTITAPEIDVQESNVSIENNATSPVDFGVSTLNQPITKTFIIENTGTSDLDISSISLSGTQYTLTHSISTISDNGNESFTVTLNANAIGTYADTITIISNDFNEAIYKIAITGSIQSPVMEVYVGEDNTGSPIVNLQTAPIDFGSVVSGNSIDMIFALFNNGNDNLILNNISLTENNFTLGGFSSSVSAGVIENFMVSLNSSITGVYTDTVVIESNDPEEAIFKFPITGTITASPEPEISVYEGTSTSGQVIASGSVTPIDLGTVSQGASTTADFTIENTGTAALILTTITSQSNLFTVNNAVSSISVGTTASFSIDFTTTTTPGIYTDTLEIVSNDSDESTFKFAITIEVALAAPETLCTHPTDSKMDLIWSPVVGASSYTLLYGTDSTSSLIAIPDITETFLTVDNLDNQTTYYFAITAGGDTSHFEAATPVVEAGNALVFNGNEYIYNPTLVDPQNSETTWELWVKPATASPIFSVSNTWVGDDYSNALSVTATGQLKFDYTISNGTPFSITTSGDVLDGQWHHVAVVSGNGGIEIYIDGELVSNSGSGLSSGHGGTFRLGQLSAGTLATYYEGEIDEFRWWNKRLTSSEIIAKRDQPLIGDEQDLKLVWHFDEASTSTMVYDASCQNIDGYKATGTYQVVSSGALTPYQTALTATTYGQDSIVVNWNTNIALDVNEWWLYESTDENIDTASATKHTLSGALDTSFTIKPLTGCDTLWFTVVGVDNSLQVASIAVTDSASYCLPCDALVVSSTDDDLTCGTLRYAITEANKTLQLDTITFADLGSDNTIQLTSELPVITSPLFINGQSSPLWTDTPVIDFAGDELDYVFSIEANQTTVKGFAFSQLTNTDALIEGYNADEITIQNCHFNIDPSGQIAGGSSIVGIKLQQSGHHIIGGTNTDKNLFGRSTDANLSLFGVSHSTITGNYFGTTVQQGNTSNDLKPTTAIKLSALSDSNTITLNVIAATSEDAVIIKNTKYTSITENYFGANTNGQYVEGWSSAQNWLALENASFNNIGLVNQGNVFLNATFSAITLTDGSYGNQMIDNTLGLELNTESSTYQNTTYTGISIIESNANQIGGLTKAEGNTITGMNFGVFIDKDSLNTIWSNSIYDNITSPITFINQAQSEIAPPYIGLTGDSMFVGTSAPHAYIQLFANSGHETEYLIDTLSADQNGNWSYKWSSTQLANLASLGLDSLTALQDSASQTSEVSNARRIYIAEPIVVIDSVFNSIEDSVFVVKVPEILSDPSFILDTTSIKILTAPTTGATATLTSSGDLTLDFTTDANGASEDSVLIEICDIFGNCRQTYLTFTIDDEKYIPNLIVYNMMSLDDDGKNEFLHLFDIENFDKETEVILFDKWGNKMLTFTDYDNTDENKRWNGNLNGEKVPSGTYFYVIKLKLDGKKHKDPEGEDKGFIEVYSNDK